MNNLIQWSKSCTAFHPEDFNKLKELGKLAEQLQARALGLEATNKALEQNRDQYKREAYALVVHVERLKEVIERKGREIFTIDDYEFCEAVMSQAPAVSLAEYDAEVARRAYSDAIASVPDLIHKGYGAGDMLALADELANEYAERIKRGEV